MPVSDVIQSGVRHCVKARAAAGVRNTRGRQGHRVTLTAQGALRTPRSVVAHDVGMPLDSLCLSILDGRTHNSIWVVFLLHK